MRYQIVTYRNAFSLSTHRYARQALINALYAHYTSHHYSLHLLCLASSVLDRLHPRRHHQLRIPLRHYRLLIRSLNPLLYMRPHRNPVQRQPELEIKTFTVAPARADNAGQAVALAAVRALAAAAVVHAREAFGAQGVTAGTAGVDGFGGALVVGGALMVGGAEAGGFVGDFGEEGAH